MLFNRTGIHSTEIRSTKRNNKIKFKKLKYLILCHCSRLRLLVATLLASLIYSLRIHVRRAEVSTKMWMLLCADFLSFFPNFFRSLRRWTVSDNSLLSDHTHPKDCNCRKVDWDHCRKIEFETYDYQGKEIHQVQTVAHFPRNHCTINLTYLTRIKFVNSLFIFIFSLSSLVVNLLPDTLKLFF